MNTDELPEGWTTSTVGEVSAAIQYGHTASAQHGKPGPRFLRITDIQDGRVDWESVPTCDVSESELKKYDLRAGDIVFARTGATTGKSYLIRHCPEAVFASYLIRLRCTPAILPECLSLFFQTSTYWQLISENVSGNAQPNCNASKLAELDFPLPPVAEQRRIVAAVERILGNVMAARARLDRVPTTLKRFRQAVLAAACSGRLTEDWRVKQADTIPANQLLQSLADSRGVTVPNGQADELPDNWATATLGYLTDWGTRSRPFITSGSRGWAKLVGSVGRYFIRSENINTDYLRLEDAVRVDVSDGSEADRTKVRAGDLLLTITGNNVGRTAVVPDGCPDAHVSQHVAIIRIDRAVDVNYVWLWLRSEQHGKSGFEHYGETKPGLNLEQIREHVVNLPPLAEQQEIVNRVLALFDRADAIEAAVTAARKRVDTLTQAVLAKAFRGELVPTEAELARRENRPYEPAADLLARLQSTATAIAKPTRTRKTKTPPTS